MANQLSTGNKYSIRTDLVLDGKTDGYLSAADRAKAFPIVEKIMALGQTETSLSQDTYRADKQAALDAFHEDPNPENTARLAALKDEKTVMARNNDAAWHVRH